MDVLSVVAAPESKEKLFAASKGSATSNNSKSTHVHQSHHSKKSHSNQYFTIHGFLKDQLILIIIAGLLAYGFYNHGEGALNQVWNKMMNQFSAPAPQTNNGITLETMQIIYDEIYNLRRDTNEMFEQLAEMIIKQQQQQQQHNMQDDYLFEPIGIMQFEKAFNMEPLDGVMVDEKFQDLMGNYDITADPAYQDNKEDYEMIVQQYGEEIMLLPSMSLDTRFFVQWSMEKQDYCLFSAAPLPVGTFLGTYAGVLTNDTDDLSKTWRFRGTVDDADGSPIDLIIDGRDKGNWFYFMQIQEYGNVEPFFIPYGNMWHVGFRTSRPVHAFEELSLNQSDLE